VNWKIFNQSTFVSLYFLLSMCKKFNLKNFSTLKFSIIVNFQQKREKSILRKIYNKIWFLISDIKLTFCAIYRTLVCLHLNPPYSQNSQISQIPVLLFSEEDEGRAQKAHSRNRFRSRSAWIGPGGRFATRARGRVAGDRGRSTGSRMLGPLGATLEHVCVIAAI